MKNIVLENEYLRVEISPKGAELQSLLNKATGKEQLWQGDAAIWKDRSPWLFPVIGQLKDGSYRFNGKTYSMPIHGFASGMPFAVEENDGNHAVFTLGANADTLAVFPWRFELRIAYCLNAGQLHTTCTVRCCDDEEMYFSFGAHPGFLCRTGDIVAFPEDNELHCQRLEAGTHLVLPAVTTISPSVRLEESLFDNDAMLLRSPASTAAELRRADGSGIRFSFGSVSWVGLWSRKHAGLPYICIEPWHGVDDYVDASGELTEKAGIVRLPAGETFSMHLSIAPF